MVPRDGNYGSSHFKKPIEEGLANNHLTMRFHRIIFYNMSLTVGILDERCVHFLLPHFPERDYKFLNFNCILEE